jgi:hypothetical protein
MDGLQPANLAIRSPQQRCALALGVPGYADPVVPAHKVAIGVGAPWPLPWSGRVRLMRLLLELVVFGLGVAA